jgi:hypothetical protein
MIDKKLFSATIFIICLVFFLSACGPAATATPTARAAGLLNRPTRTPEPPTAVPATATPLPSPTETPIPPATATLTPAPLLNWSGASVYSSGILPHFKALITIKNTADVVGQYYAIVQDDKPYTCTTYSEWPHLLYCTGPLAGVQKFVHFALFQKGVTYPVFQADVYMPMIDTPLP